jgi:hypothetical protein
VVLVVGSDIFLILTVLQLIAIKQTEIEDRERDRDGEPTYPWEALIMGKLKASGCQTIVKLRKLRIMTNATPRRWRYYMECYKLGTLQDLVTHNLKQKSVRCPLARNLVLTFYSQAYTPRRISMASIPRLCPHSISHGKSQV